MAIVIVAGAAVVAGYWYSTTKRVEAPPLPASKLPIAKTPDNDGPAEQSEVMEPIVVDARNNPAEDAAKGPVVHIDMMPAVVSAPGAAQPPRPDAQPGRTLRMPYADEEDIDGLDRDPISRILDPNLWPLNLFEGLKNVLDEPPPAK
ncbi:MAG: hypothetical protein HYR84_13060 [Planctomycetes bacterium]|nr:hypothetical protein [Planctomycetota bacterium]